MTQSDKELLLKDLCARLPYNVKVKVECGDIPYGPTVLSKLDIKRKVALFDFEVRIENCKPYLRPMSSMTEEERKEYEGFIIHRDHVIAQGQEWDIDCFSFNNSSRLIDWLNKNHFDYRGLIEKGLALEAPEDIYI